MKKNSANIIADTNISDNLIVSVKLESGKFDCLLKIPMDKEPKEKKYLFEGWLQMLEIFLSKPKETEGL